MMRKLYIILLFITCCGLLSAQSYKPISVEVQLRDQNTGSSDGLGGYLIRCDSKKEAEDLLAQYRKNLLMYGNEASDAFSSMSFSSNKTSMFNDDGAKLTITVRPDGYFLVFVLGANGKEAFLLESVNGRTKIEIPVKVRTTEGEALVEADQLVSPPGEMLKGVTHGIRVTLRNLMWTREEHSLNNARYVLQPVVYNGCENDSVFTQSNQYMVLPPYIVDGIEYKQTQKRRMLFDESNDPLTQWRVKKEIDEKKTKDTVKTQLKEIVTENQKDTVLLMRTRKKSEFRLNDSFNKKSKDHKVNVQGYIWYEDYNFPYFKEQFELASCRMRDPMRFLECDSILKSYPMLVDKNSFYWVEPNTQPIEEPGNLSLNFVNGKAELEPTDTMGLRQLAELRELLGTLSHDDSKEFWGITIKGQASPDGRFTTNDRLSRERMQYAVREATALMKKGPKIDATSSVASWEQVADILEADSLFELADKIRGIVKALPKRPDEQGGRIRNIPEYKTKILPAAEKLRTISYSYTYTNYRVLEPEEIYERWQNDEDYRSGNKSMEYYEYCYLFDYFKEDTTVMRILSERAYKRFNTRFKKMDAPWPLAAYHYAQCQLRNGICDTTILLPYIKKGNYKPNIRSQESRLDGKGGLEVTKLYNDPAIVSLQVAIKIELGDYVSAYNYTYYLPEDRDRNRLQAFLKCLAGFYEYDCPERKLVMNSSPMNKVVIYTALNKEKYNIQASILLNDTTLFPKQDDYRILYLRSILAARKKNGQGKSAWGNPEFILQKDCPYIYDLWRLDEKYYQMTIDDGEFENSVRNDFIKLWDFYKRYGDEYMQRIKRKDIDLEFQNDNKTGRWKLFEYDKDGNRHEVQEIQYQ